MIIQMPSSALDRIRVSKTVRIFLEQRRPPEPVREKLDYGFLFYRHTVELLEIRPKWRKPGKKKFAFAKAVFVKARGAWRVYWRRASLKWRLYEPPTARSLSAFLKLVNEDKQGCFFG
jgi:hypothetical protein